MKDTMTPAENAARKENGIVFAPAWTKDVWPNGLMPDCARNITLFNSKAPNWLKNFTNGGIEIESFGCYCPLCGKYIGVNEGSSDFQDGVNINNCPHCYGSWEEPATVADLQFPDIETSIKDPSKCPRCGFLDFVGGKPRTPEIAERIKQANKLGQEA